MYPEGNWVEIGPDTPYQIIGASGFGKPILERSLQRSDSMQYAFKVGLLAFDATRLCAADVDFPMDVILYSKGSFELVEHRYYAGRPAADFQLVAGAHAAQRAGTAFGMGGSGVRAADADCGGAVRTYAGRER